MEPNVLTIVGTFALVSASQVLPAFGLEVFANEVHQVYITRNGEKICNGAAISSNEIITAASCFNRGKMSEIEVVSFDLVKQSGTRYKVNDKCIPPNFKNNAEDHANDIAVLRLRDSIELRNSNSKFKPIQLVDRDFELNDGEYIQVSGFMLDEEKRPRVVESIPFKTPNEVCRGNYSNIGGPTADQFCAHRRKATESVPCSNRTVFDFDFNACDGDAGAPASVDDKLVGFVANWIPDCQANLGLPVIFTSIAYHRDFIDQCRSKFSRKEKHQCYGDNPPRKWQRRCHGEETLLEKLEKILSSITKILFNPIRSNLGRWASFVIVEESPTYFY